MKVVKDASLPAEIYVEQVKLLYRNLPLAMFATQASALAILLVQWNTLDHRLLVAWFAAITLTVVGRMSLFIAYWRTELTPSNASRWVYGFTFGTAMAGIAWGSAGIFLFPEDLAYRMFVIFILAGMTAGAVVSFSSLWKIGLIFVLLTLTPLSARLMSEGSDMQLAMGVMSFLFMVLMVLVSRRMYETTLASLRLRFENTNLIAVLAHEKEATEELNRELRREIGERARIEAGLRESEAHIRAVIDNVLDGIITINEQGGIESVNPAALRIFGYAEADLIGLHFKMLMPEAVRHEYDDYIEKHIVAHKGKMVGFGLEISGQRQDGTRFPMELGISNMWLDSRELFIGIVRDISERREVERMKNQFMSSVNHELRTPLTSVLGSLGLLAEGVAGELSESGQSLLNIARNNVARLVRLIGDILDIDDIQSGRLKLNFKDIRPAALVERALEVFRPQATAANVELILHNAAAQAVVRGDTEHLVQAINHLLSNALKYSPRHSKVEIAVTRDAGRVRIAVTDHGPGIPETFRNRLFQPFSQADTSDSEIRSGAGLGLSIAKAIVVQHSGTLDVQSIAGQGACFYIELPELAKPQA